MRDVKNQAEKPIMRHFSGHKVDDIHFVVLQSLGREGSAYRQLHLVWILIIPQWMLISLNIDRPLFAFCLSYFFSNSLGLDQTDKLLLLIWIQVVCHVLGLTRVWSICIFNDFRMVEIILSDSEGVLFDPLWTNGFFLLVWYKLGIVHCACLGVSGCRFHFFGLKTFFVYHLVWTQMKCCIIPHFIWVLAICICGHFGVSCKQRVKGGSVPFLIISLILSKNWTSNNFDPDQAQLDVGPYHDPNFWLYGGQVIIGGSSCVSFGWEQCSNLFSIMIIMNFIFIILLLLLLFIYFILLLIIIIIIIIYSFITIYYFYIYNINAIVQVIGMWFCLLSDVTSFGAYVSGISIERTGNPVMLPLTIS